MNREIDRKVNLWEQHGQTLLLSIITAALLWAAKTQYEANALQATLVARIDNLSANVARLEGAVATMQQQFVTRAEFAVHEARIQAVERRARP